MKHLTKKTLLALISAACVTGIAVDSSASPSESSCPPTVCSAVLNQSFDNYGNPNGYICTCTCTGYIIGLMQCVQATKGYTQIITNTPSAEAHQECPSWCNGLVNAPLS